MGTSLTRMIPGNKPFGALRELWMDADSTVRAPNDSWVMVEKAKNLMQKHFVSTSRKEDKGVYKKPFSLYIKNSITPDLLSITLSNSSNKNNLIKSDQLPSGLEYLYGTHFKEGFLGYRPMRQSVVVTRVPLQDTKCDNF